MKTGKKICKICGKEYPYCKSFKQHDDNVFRWQDVACCPEHGYQYLEMIQKSRGNNDNINMPKENTNKEYDIELVGRTLMPVPDEDSDIEMDICDTPYAYEEELI